MRIMMPSATPRSEASFLAFARLPLTWPASCLEVSTVAPGSSFLMAAATASTLDDLFTSTNTSFTRPGCDDADCKVLMSK